MTLTKGTIIKQVKRNERSGFENTMANSELTYEVTRVNKTTYTLKCIEGFMKGSGCKLVKNFNETSVDEYGTTTEWIIL